MKDRRFNNVRDFLSERKEQVSEKEAEQRLKQSFNSSPELTRKYREEGIIKGENFVYKPHTLQFKGGFHAIIHIQDQGALYLGKFNQESEKWELE